MLKCGTQHVCKFSSILFSDGSKCIIAQNKRSMCLPNTCHYHLFNINDTSLILTMCDTCVTHLFASYMFLFNLSMCTCTYIFFSIIHCILSTKKKVVLSVPKLQGQETSGLHAWEKYILIYNHQCL